MKFKVVVEDIERDGKIGTFECPLALDGSENPQKALDRFLDFLFVFREAIADADGRTRFYINPDRTDGRPTPKFEALWQSNMAKLPPELRKRIDNHAT